MSVLFPPHALPWRKDNRAPSVRLVGRINSWLTRKCTWDIARLYDKILLLPPLFPVL